MENEKEQPYIILVDKTISGITKKINEKLFEDYDFLNELMIWKEGETTIYYREMIRF